MKKNLSISLLAIFAIGLFPFYALSQNNQGTEINGISTNNLTIIFFHATGCWHSETFEIAWDKFVEQNKENNINFLKLDWRGKGKDKFDILRKPLKQWSVPMIAFVKNKKMIHETIVAMDYRGKRMTRFVKATPENAAQVKIWDLKRLKEFIQPIIKLHQN